MSSEDEVWRDNENADAGRDGNQFDREDYGHTPGFRPQRSYSSNGTGRTPRPRFNPNAGEAGRRVSYSSSRPYRPRFESAEGDARPQRAYSSDRPQRSYYSSDNSDRPARSYNRPYRSYNSGEEGEHPQRPQGDRPYRPRFNSEGGQRSYGDRPQRVFGERPFRPRFQGDDHQGRGGQRKFQQSRPGYKPNAKYSRKKQIEYKEQFVDPEEPIRLNKYLANAGVCSRREADEFITAGVVTVNGEVVTELGTKIKRGDKVMFHDQPVTIERKIYILLNKPKDTVTTSDDPQARKTVLDLVKNACPERIYPVGRLDRNTTGVLLLTNDGDLASKLTHPKFTPRQEADSR